MNLGDNSGKWTRREFLQAGVCAAAGSIAGTTHALRPNPQVYHAIMTTPGRDGATPSVRSVRVRDGIWQQVHEVAAARPGHLVSHPALPVVYVCHDVAAWGHLPRGAVSAYQLNSVSGQLTLLNTQPLSLSAVHPQFATVIENGRYLLVLTRGGIYNLLPLTQDGDVLPVSAIRKEFGRTCGGGSKAAVPRHAAQHSDGTLLTVDSGQETLSRFCFAADGLLLQDRVRVHASAGARQLALSPCGQRVYVLHDANASISVHRISSGGILPAHQAIAGGEGDACMLLLPCGHFLLRADSSSMSMFRLDAQTGQIGEVCDSVSVGLQQLAFAPDLKEVIGLQTSTGKILAVALQVGSGSFGMLRTVARVAGCTALAFC